MESTSQLKSITSSQSNSQKIIDDEVVDNSKAISFSKQPEDIKEKSSSQIIEDGSEDLSQFDKDVSSFFILI